MLKPIVILHGWGSDLKKWQPLKKTLQTQGFKVFLPSLPGFGKQSIFAPMSTQDYTNWLDKYLTTKKLSQINLVGHSFGGQIAINFTANYPQKVNKLILINSAGIRNKLSLKRLVFTPIAKLGKIFFTLPPFCFIKSLAQHTFYRFLRETDYYQASPAMKQTLKKILTEDQQDQMRKITRPTLILWSQHDTYTPLADGQLTNKLIKKSQLKVIPKATHGLPFHQPQAVAKKILWFIS